MLRGNVCQKGFHDLFRVRNYGEGGSPALSRTACISFDVCLLWKSVVADEVSMWFNTLFIHLFTCSVSGVHPQKNV